MILSPRPLTWRRWHALSTSRYSILRGLEYERISGVRLAGRTLDLGGGLRSSYNHLFEMAGTLESVNTDPSMWPTLIADLNAPLPLTSACYDNVISLNTFEHLRHDVAALRETMRVLKPGGHLHIVVPFLYRVHASPGDYHRHTAFWWIDVLVAHGIDRTTLTVEPLLWDPLSSAFSVVEFQFGRFRALPKKLVMLPSVLRWTVRSGPSERELRHGDPRAEYALGYYIHGIKH